MVGARLVETDPTPMVTMQTAGRARQGLAPDRPRSGEAGFLCRGQAITKVFPPRDFGLRPLTSTAISRPAPKVLAECLRSAAGAPPAVVQLACAAPPREMSGDVR